MADEMSRATELVGQASARTAEILDALDGMDDVDFDEPSELPGWSRLTIACHLRFNSTASARMTRDTLAHRPTSYYPDGRAQQRPATLGPAPGERAQAVLDSWARVAAELDELWSSLDDDAWVLDVVEPPDRSDLGTVPLARLALARLTEVDVHGVDLGLGLSDWSAVLVQVALPTRLRWLSTRRSNHRSFDRSLQGSWLLVAESGLRWQVSVDGDRVESGPADGSTTAPRATITGSDRDLLALMLDRPARQPLDVEGDVQFGTAFSRAFPGP